MSRPQPRLFADALYHEVRTAWERDQNHPGRGRVVKPLPDTSAFATLIDPAFKASMQTEEGRPIRCSVLLMTRTLPQPGHTFTFAQPLPYSDRTLRKLAGAYATSNATFLAEASAAGEPTIWGFGYYGSASHKETSLPVGTPYDVFWPDELLVRIDSPGKLLIARGDSTIGIVEYGVFAPSIPSPLISPAMGNRLIAAISTDAGYVAHGVYYWQAYNVVLERFLRQVNRVSHGATIILVPSGRKAEMLDKFHGGLVPNGSYQIAELIIKRLEKNDDPTFGIILSSALTARLYERIASLAQLACIDGALILTTDFEVLAFGAKLHSPEWPGLVVVDADGFNENGESFDLKRLGTRHNSAAALVGECEFVIAFVSSADGPIRGIANDTARQRLCCWPDLRASMKLSDLA